MTKSIQHGMMAAPRQLSIDEVIGQLDDPALAVLDTRADRAAFMKTHLPGSLYAPAQGSFSDFARSYLKPDQRIVLVVDFADQLEEQVRQLMRIGFDKIEGWLSVAALASADGKLVSIPSVKFREVPALMAEDPDTLIPDVRGADEYEAGHIRGALSVAHNRLQGRAAEVPTNRTVIVHCQSGNRAAASAAFLRRNGRRTIYVNDAFGNVLEELLA
jgi:hydroxyacylglutathione hydrolase